MKRIFLFMLFLIWGYVLWGQSLMDTIFGPSNANDRQMILINQSFNKNDELNINLINLSDLAISGDIRFTEGRFGFVRLILEDESEREYLLLEENKWFSKEPIFHFENRCMETKMLDNVHALRIKVICKNAQVTIKNLSYTTSIPYDAKLDMRYQRLQIQAICNKWNEYNKETGQLWYAHVDENIHLSYKDIKQKHGDRDDFIPDGMDFYAGGIFVIWDFDNDSISPFTKETIKKAPLAASTSPFIEHFDWRNRHGRSWVTNVKNQKEPVMPNSLGNGGCWAFSVCATVESAYRLYFNRRDNIDLSEQELGSCTSGSLSIQGGLPTDALEYIKNSGITTETCFPFQNNCTIPCSDKCLNPLEVITINNYSSVFKNQDSIKSALIHYGPISSGLITRYCSHCMELVGYNSIHAGDVLTFYKPNDTTPAIDTIVPANSQYIGQTYWIFKNSYGTGEHHNGFIFALFENFNSISWNYKVHMPIYSQKYSNDSIVCEDRDGDGYYFWGLGSKPNTCPACCPNTPDGDDGDPLIGPIDFFGYPISYVDPYGDMVITNDTIISDGDWHLCENIRITNNAKVTLVSTASISLSGHSSIIVESGKFIVEGGVINKARIIVKNNAKLILRNNAIINLGELGFIVSEPAGMIEDELCEIRTETSIQNPSQSQSINM